nr:Alstrom syndrome protein 1 [Vulpes vulpes]
MEPEDLPWPGELEEEEEEEEAEEEAEEPEEPEEPANLGSEEVVMVEEVEEEQRRELDPDFNYESPPRESTDEEDDEEAEAWLQAHPAGPLPPSPLSRHRFSQNQQTGREQVVPLTHHVWQESSYQGNSGTQISDTNVVFVEKTAWWGSRNDQRTESWHYPPQEMDSSHTLDTTQTRFNMREEGTEVTDFPSVEEGILTQPENQVKKSKRDLLCSPLLVIQDNFASPDLPLLTCLTQDQEFESDSLFQPSELEFVPLRGIPGKSEDTEWFSRPSEVSEALFQAASEVASDLGNSCITVSQHSLIASTAVESQHSFLPLEQGTKEETISSDTVDELKTPKDFDSYDALCSYMTWKTQEVQEPETSLTDKGQASVSTSSYTSDEYMTPEGSDSFDASCSYVQYWKQKALQQSEKYLTSKDHHSYSDSFDTVDKNTIPKGSDNFSAPFAYMPWSKHQASHHPETCVISKSHVSFPHEVAPHFNNKMSHSFLHCLLERRGEGIPLTAHGHYFESVYVRAPAENEVKEVMNSLEGYERNEEGLGKELSQGFELKENRSALVFSEVHPRSSEIQYCENIVVPGNSVKVSEIHIHSSGHGTSQMEVSGVPLQTIKSTLDQVSERLYFQEEGNQRATCVFGGKSVDASENVAFEVVIASIEPSKKENTVNEIQTDISKFLVNDSQEREPKNPHLSLLNYNNENSFFDELSHPCYQSPPGVFELEASKSLLHKKVNGDSSLYWHLNLKSLPSAPQEMFIKPLSLIPEFKSSASLSEKSHSQAVSLGKAQSALFQCDLDNEPFLPIGKIKSVPALDLAEKVGSSNIFYPMKVSTSDSLVLQDLRRFEEVADSSNYILGKNVNSSNMLEGPSAVVGSSFSANLVTYDAKSQGTLPVTSNASLITVSQGTLLKADAGQGKIPWPMGDKSSFTTHTIMQNDSYFIEGLQGKPESGTYTLDDDTECCNLDENAVVCSTRVDDLQREICEQDDLTSECIELASLKNVLDDLEVCDSSLDWESDLQLPSKEESDFEEPVGHSNTDINQPFSSILPPFIPHVPARELEYHSSDLRMLRVSPDTVQKTLKHSAGDTSKGGIAEITQSSLKPGITTTPRESDTGSLLSLFPEDFPPLALRSPQEITIGQHSDTLHQQELVGSHKTEETPKVSTVPKLDDQNTGISTVPSSSYSQRGKPSILHQQSLPDKSHLTEEAVRVSAFSGLTDQKTDIPTVLPSSYSLREKHNIFYQQALPDSHLTEEAVRVSAVPGPADQKTRIPIVLPGSYSFGEKPSFFYQQALPVSHLTEEALRVSVVPGPADQKTRIPIVLPGSYSLGEKHKIFCQQALPNSHLTKETLKVSAVPGPVEQKSVIPIVLPGSYLLGEKHNIFHPPTLPESHLTEEAVRVSAAVPGSVDQKTGIPTVLPGSFSLGEKASIFHQQALPENHLTKEALRVSAVPGPIDQKTGIPTVLPVLPGSYSLGEKRNIFHPENLPDSHLTEEALRVSAVPSPADQKTDIPTVLPGSYSLGEKRNIFHPENLPESHLTEEALKVLAVPGLADQKTGIPTVLPGSYSLGEKHHIFHSKNLPDSPLTEEAIRVSAFPGPVDQKTDIPTGFPGSYSLEEKRNIVYPEILLDSLLTEEAVRVLAVPGPDDQKTDVPTGLPGSYSLGEKYNIVHPETLPDNHLIEEAVRVSAVPGPVDQKTGIPTGLPGSYSLGEKHSIFHPEILPDNHLTEEAVRVLTVPGPPDQKTDRPTGHPGSYSPREKHNIFYPQTLPESPRTEEALRVSAVPGPVDQKTGRPTVLPGSYSPGEKHHILHPEILPDSHLTEESLKISTVPVPTDQRTEKIIVPSASLSQREKHVIFSQQQLSDGDLTAQVLKASVASGPADQNIGLPTLSSSSYSLGEKHCYQQALLDSHLIEQAQKVAAVPRPADQKTRIPLASSTSYLQGERPHIFCQQTLPESDLTEQALKYSAPGSAEQKTGIPTLTSTSYSHREKSSISHQQKLPDSPLADQAQKVPAVPGPAEKKSGSLSEASNFSSRREKHSIFYQQEFLGSSLIEPAQKVSPVPGPTDQKPEISTVTSTYSHVEKPFIFYPQGLPDSPLPEEALKVTAVSEPADQQTGTPVVPSSSYSLGEKPSIFYPQGLTDVYLTKEALKVSAISGSADWKIGIPTVSSASYSNREKPVIFYPQGLTDSQLPQEALNVSAIPGPADQKTGLPSEPSSSYSLREKPIIFYPQDLTNSQVPQAALKVSAIPGPADQKTGLPLEDSSSYSPREKPIIFYPQGLTDSQLPQAALKLSAIPGPADQKTRLPSEPSSSYSFREKPIIFYPQGLTDNQLPQEALKVSAIPEPADQKTEFPSEPSTSYSPREKPSIFYPQDLTDSHLPQKALKVSAIPGPADQKTELPSELSSSYSPGEKPIIFYPQGLTDSHLPQEALKVSAIPGPADQKTELPSEPSTSYSPREKPSIFYPQGLTDSQLPQEPLNISAVPGPADQKTELPSESSSSYSPGEKPIIFYSQGLIDGHVPQVALKVSATPGLADQKTGLPSEPSNSYSPREKPIIFYPQGLTDSQLPQEPLNISALPGPADQKTGLPSESSSSYSPGEKPIIFYSQGLIDGHVPQVALKVSATPGLADQKTGLPSEPSNSYSPREKPIIFYPQGLTESQLPQEALKVSAILGPGDQKTGLPSEPSSSYSHREKSNILYAQEFPGSHLTEEALKVSAFSGIGDQKTGIPTVLSSSYSLGGKPIIFYQQALSDRHLTDEALNVSASSGPADQETGIPTVSSVSYSHRERPSILYQQPFSDNQLAIPALKVSAVSGSDDQKTRKPTITSASYSEREKPIIYHQELPDLTQESLNVFRIPGLGDQRTGITAVTSTTYSHREKPVISYQQELPAPNKGALKVLGAPGSADQQSGIRFKPSTSYSHRESPIFSYLESPDITEETLKVSAVSGPGDQKTGIHIIPSSSYSYREKDSIFYQEELPDVTEAALKVFALPEPADQKTEIPTGPSSSYSHEEKLKISPVILPDDQETELLTAPLSFYSQREKPKISTVIGSDNQKTPLLTVLHNSYSQKVKPGIFFQHQLSDKHQSENILKISAVSEPIDVNSGIPISLFSSYSHREKSNNFYPQELPDKHLGEGALKVSTIPLPADQKSLLPTPPSSFSHREQPDIFCQQDFPDRHLTQDALMFSSGVGQVDQITGLSTVTPGTYSYSEKQKLVSDHVQMLIDNLHSSNSSVTSNSMPLNSQADGRVIISKPESSSFEDVRSEEIQDRSSGSKTLKEIRTLLMEAENIALKRCNFPAPLVPFRDVSDISFIQSKKVVCFKEPLTADEYNGDLPQRQPFIEESPSNKCIQKDISTQTNLKCQRGIENWEFISSTTVRSPLQEAESKARVTVDETLRQYRAAKSVMRSEPEGYSGTIGNKIVIPMMTIIKSDSSSDASSCSWDSNSLESVSDVLLNFFPYSSPKTSLTDSREEGVSESDDGGGSSVDSLAAHVRNLLKCESSLNHAKQILRNAEEEECRVRARAWNLKFNLAHECGYSISELNEDDRRKVEEIKAKLFSHERTTDLSKGLQSPRGIGCKPEAVCSHIIIESHEKGCFRTLTAEQPQLDSHPCAFRSADPSDMIRGQRSPSSWRTRHIDLSKSLDQCNPHFKIWNSLQLRSHSPFQNFAADDFRISQGLRMPFHEKIDPWLSELVEPASVPLEEMDCHSSQMLPPEPMKKFTTSITFSSHRHSKCFSDSSVLKVGVTEGSQCTGASVGVFNSHFTEEQNPPRDLEQRTSSPSSFKIVSHSPDKAVTILAESSRQSQKLSVEHSQQEEKFLERSDFKSSDSEPSTSTKCSNVKEVHFSDNHTFISMSRPSSTLGVKEKNVTITPDLSSHIILEQRQLFEQSKAPHADHHVRKHHSPPPQHQDYVAPNLPCRIFLEKQELFEQSKAPHLDHQMRENHSPFQGQDYIASDLPSSIFLEQRQLFEQSKAPDVDHMGKYHSPIPQVQDYVVEKNNQHKFKSYISNMINVEAKFDNVISQSAPSQCTLVTSTSASTPPSNRKALSCFRITLYPKTPSKLDSGTLDKRFHTLDPASKTRMNSEFNSDLQTISSRSLEPTSKLLASKPIAQNQESLGFVGPKSSPDFQVVQSPLPDSNDISQDLKSILFQNSQIVTSRQTQVNISDLEGYSSPEGTPVSADRSSEGIKAPFSAFPGKLSSDAVTQITTESPGKTMFSSEIFINAKDRGLAISEPSTQKLGKGPVKFASSSSVQQITHPHGTDAQPSLLPYKPPGSTQMYYVPQLRQIPPSLDSKSDTTVESSHSGSNDAIAPDFPAEVLGTRDDDLTVPANIKHKEGIYSKRVVPKASLLVGRKTPQKDNADAQVQVSITEDENLSDKNQKKEIYTKKTVTKAAQPEEESLQKASKGSSDAAAAEHSARLQDIKLESLPDTKAIKQKEEILNKRTFPKEAWKEDKESLQIDIAESRCHSEFENTTHSVFRSAKFYFHHPVHLPSDQDFCHESLGRSVFMRHSLKDFFQHHPDKQREHTSLPSPRQNVEKTKTDYTRIESLSINVNLENDVMHTAKSRAKDNPKSDKQLNDQKRDHKVTPEPTAQHTVSLNELWNRYQERQRQQRPPQFGDRKELSLVDRLDRLAKLLQNPITYSLRTSESTQDDSRGERDVKEWSGRQQQQKNKLQKKKRYKSLEKFHKNAGELKKSKMLSTHQAGKSNQIKIEQIKFDKYILRKQPDFHYRNNTSSDSRPSEESELLTDTATNLLSTTTSPVESDILTQTDREVTLQERSSSISTIDTARLIQAFGHERVCLSPRQIKLYSSITDHQRRYLERRSKKNKKALNMNHPQMTSEHTRRKHIQVADHVISSDSVSSSTSSFWSSSSTLCNMQNVQMLNKAVQAGNLEIVNGVKKHTRDVGMTFPTPSSSEARIEEDSDMTSWSEEKIEEKRLLTNYLGDKKLRKNKHSCCEGVSWFVPVENVKSEPKKENLPKLHGPGVCWFAPITNTKPWREPLREQNWQGQHVDGHRPLAGPDRERLRPFVRATLQESLHLHRPDFISRSGERIKRLKLIVQERKLQNMLESEREALFNVSREWQGYRDPTHLLPKRGFLDARKSRPIGKKEMIQRSKRIYEQLPEVQRKREEEKRRLEYKSYRLRAQLFKKKVTNQLLGRKVPWN